MCNLITLYHTYIDFTWINLSIYLPLTSKINRVHPLFIANMSVKLDKEVHNSLVSIAFTS